RIGFRTNRPGARHASERSHAAAQHLRALARMQIIFRMDQYDGAIADDDGALLREIEGDDGNFFRVDVEPHIEFGPIRERTDADALASVDSGVEDIPQLRALIFGIPLPERVAEGIDSFFGARFFLITAGAAK